MLFVLFLFESMVCVLVSVDGLYRGILFFFVCFCMMLIVMNVFFCLCLILLSSMFWVLFCCD